ncbi:MAG: amidohydrolase [Planctomycetota bacterium]
MENTALVEFRRSLHARPELSGAEIGTHDAVRDRLRGFGPIQMLERLGGTGLAAIYDSGTPGPRVMVRAELDALPIIERGSPPYASTNAGVMHACGHDGHMAILVGLAAALAGRPPERGRVVLLFQPAEETGAGAAAVLADDRWSNFEPDIAIALHNLPGYPLGGIVLSEGVFCCASRGMRVVLSGTAGHAAHPEDARNPALAIASLVAALPGLPQRALSGAFGCVTVCHVHAGDDRVFGTSPEVGTACMTLRTSTDRDMALLAREAEGTVHRVAETHGMAAEISWHDDFPAAACDASTVGLVRDAASRLGLETIERTEPFRWSEDFGRFTQGRRGVLFGLGAGLDQPQLHHPEYDFPDELIPLGVRLLETIVRRTTSDSSG